MAIGYEHVGVIGAMAEEVDRLHRHLDAETVTEDAGRTYRHGRLDGRARHGRPVADRKGGRSAHRGVARS